MSIEVIINGTTRIVTKQELFDLASQGVINPQTNLLIDGKLATAGKVSRWWRRRWGDSSAGWPGDYARDQ